MYKNLLIVHSFAHEKNFNAKVFSYVKLISKKSFNIQSKKASTYLTSIININKHFLSET